MNKYNLCKLFSIKKETEDTILEAEASLLSKFVSIDLIKEYNQLKIIKAMQDSNLNYTNFYWNTGYGYNDPGREKVEEIYAKVFNTEDALVRPNIVSGTHALYLTLSAITKYGDTILSVSGKPYDTLLTVLGVEGNEANSLKSQGIAYKEVSLKNKKDFDYDTIFDSIDQSTRVIMIQRSTGYSDRKAIIISKIEECISKIKSHHPNIIIMVDNCYGEFMETSEPSDVGADLVVGSLIKNPGGGIALTGGYICGKTHLINMIANRLTAPGIGKEVGLTFGQTRNTLQGLYLAPSAVCESLKGSLLIAALFKSLGFEVIPDLNDQRSDIIQSVVFNSKKLLVKFCQGVQRSSPVDSQAITEPWAMPGYTNEVIMASGAFVQGSSIEISADAPIREPYTAFFQGGLTYTQCKLAAAITYEDIKKEVE
ncbi:MAG: methionine gamma-lyase family protein [Dethiosulfatibacter sp.]|nr:methionine gamma-lyase family protein [Dethiosulfatibacter sp.]